MQVLRCAAAPETLFFPHWGNSRWWKTSEGAKRPECVDPAKRSFDSNNAPLGVKVYCFSPLSQHQGWNFHIKFDKYCSFLAAAAAGSSSVYNIG